MYPIGIDLEELDVESINREALIDDLREDIVEAYGDREEELGSELMRALERFMLLQIIDERWREHLHDMDYLREGIHLRGFAQIDPLVAYKNEAFEMFTGPDERHLGGVRPLHLRASRSRREATVATTARRPAASAWGSGSNTSSTSSFSYAGGTAADQPSAWPRARRRRARARSRTRPTTPTTRSSVPAPRGDQDGGREGPHRAQRALLVRLGQEVQEVPWRLSAPRPPRAADAARGLPLTLPV